MIKHHYTIENFYYDQDQVLSEDGVGYDWKNADFCNLSEGKRDHSVILRPHPSADYHPTDCVELTNADLNKAVEKILNEEFDYQIRNLPENCLRDIFDATPNGWDMVLGHAINDRRAK